MLQSHRAPNWTCCLQYGMPYRYADSISHFFNHSTNCAPDRGQSVQASRVDGLRRQTMRRVFNRVEIFPSTRQLEILLRAFSIPSALLSLGMI